MTASRSAQTRGGIVTSLIIAILVIALLVSWLILFTRSIGCTKPYQNDGSIGGYWIHFEVGSRRPECVQYAS